MADPRAEAFGQTPEGIRVIGAAVCAWCDDFMGVVPFEGVTHGICQTCMATQLKYFYDRSRVEKGREEQEE